MNRLLRTRRFASTIIGLSVLAAACGGGDRNGPVSSVQAATVEAASAVIQNGVAAAAVSPAPTVVVKDAAGRPVSGVLVQWTVVSGGGRVGNVSSRTNASGVASSGGWTLGSAVGVQTLDAAVAGVGTVRFTANVSTGAPSRLVRLSPEGQTAVVGQPVAQPPSVRVEDAAGNPVSGVTVTFTVVSGGGTITGAQKVTNANGIATADAWILGTTRGAQLARATATGGASITFSANALSGPPATIEIVSGNNQQGIGGLQLPSPLTVRVRDQFGNPVQGVTVVATPTSSSGNTTPATAITNENGIATFVWIPGSSGSQSVTITVPAVPGISVTFVATITATDFTIAVRYVDFTPNARQQLAVDRALAKFRSIILSNTGTSQANFPAGFCGREWTPALNELVSGLLIFARIGPIDEPNVIGNASVCALHPASGLPAVGSLLLDSEELAALEANGLVDPLVAHEMGHTIGIGTSSQWASLVSAGCPANDPHFTGPNANARFLEVGGAQYTGNKVPVENAFSGSGSNCAHWRESVLDRELMTSQLDAGSNPLSVVTIGALADMGYSVSYASADPFQLFTAPFVIGGAPSITLRNDVLPMVPLPPGATIRTVTPPVRR